MVERSEAEVRAADQAKLRVLEVGICGTDLDKANGHRADLADETWNGTVRCVITHRIPAADFASVIYKRLPDEIKSVIIWGAP